MAICRHWKRGHCQMGSKCGFQHPRVKLSDIETSDQGYHVRGHSERMIRVSWRRTPRLSDVCQSTVHGAFANATTKHEAAETPPPRQLSPPPGRQHQHKDQASGSGEQSGGVQSSGGEESSGGFMHPERVSRARDSPAERPKRLQASLANSPNSKHCW